MNLLELITKNDRNVEIQIWDVEAKKWRTHESPRSTFSKIIWPQIKFYGWRPHVNRNPVRGLMLRSGMRVVVKGAGRFWQNYARGEGVFMFRSNGACDVKVVVGWSADHGESLVSKNRTNRKNKTFGCHCASDNKRCA